MMETKSTINGYTLSRAWFDFAFENQGIVSGNHGCMFLWFVEKNNRMGWAKQFGAPRDETMAAVGITSYNTYRKIFTDLVEWGFINVIKESKNQYTAHIIALSKNDSPLVQALDSALIQANIKHEYQQSTGTDTGTVAINKQTNNKKENKKTNHLSATKLSASESVEIFNSVKTYFLELYVKEFQTEYFFAAKDALKTYSIIKKVYFKMKEKQGSDVFSAMDITSSTQSYLSKALTSADPWLKSNFNLAMIDSKFNEIYSSIKKPQKPKFVF